MITIEQVVFVIPILALTASILYYALNLRNSNKAQKLQQGTRNAQFFMQFVNKIHSPEFLSFWVIMIKWEWDDLEDFEHKYGSVEHPDLFGERYSFWSTFNDLGWLVEKGIVEVEDVNALVGPVLFWMWDKFKPVIVEHRRVYNFPDQYIYWESLYNKLVEYRKQAGLTTDIPEYYDDYISTLPYR
jgi:hypothetical protein